MVIWRPSADEEYSAEAGVGYKQVGEVMPDELKPQETPQESPLPPQDDQELKDFLDNLSHEPAVPEEVVQQPDPKTLQLAEPATQLPETSQQAQQIDRYAKKFTEVADDILGNFKTDRDQINDTIEYLENIVLNGAGQRVHVEMLVAALRTKSETNASAVKLLDSYAKFLAATKGTNVFVQNNHTTIQDDLTQLLAKAPYLDEIKNAKDK